MSELQQIYDDNQQRIEMAYQAFKGAYQVMKPPPIHPTANKFQYGAKQYGMTLGLIGSVIVSASHTIPVFLGKASVGDIVFWSYEFIVGLAIFVMIEISIITFAYSATESEGNHDTANRVRNFTRGGMWFIVTIAILANVYYVLTANVTIPQDGIIAAIWEWVRVTIFLLIGTSAPVIAFMAGDILAIDVLKHNAKIRRDLQTYQDTLQEWQAGLNASWAAQKAKWGGAVNIQVSKPEPKMLENTVSDGLGQSNRGKTLNMKGALHYITEHELELETTLKTVLDSNPNATQSERAMALAEKISGDSRGYKTVIRAYQQLGKSL